MVINNKKRSTYFREVQIENVEFRTESLECKM